MSNHLHANATERLALAAADLAKLLDLSERHIWALNASARLPRPIRLGRSTRWNLAEIQRWLDAGSPSRDQWEKLREQGGTR
jgi:predicted DNA-binding transcriptional regulator AlpA